jgi:hypothetical protein
MEALSARLPSCITTPKTSTRRTLIPGEQLADLALSGMAPTSLKLALLELSGMNTTAALAELGIRRENRSRVITGRASKRMQNRR